MRSKSLAFLIGGRYGGSPTFLNSADGDLRVALSVIRADSCSGLVLGNVTTRERASGHANAVHSAGALPDFRDAARRCRIGVKSLRSSEGLIGNSMRRGMEWIATLGASSLRLVRACVRKDCRVASTGVVAARVREVMALEWTWWRERWLSSVCLRGMVRKKSRLGVK